MVWRLVVNWFRRTTYSILYANTCNDRTMSQSRLKRAFVKTVLYQGLKIFLFRWLQNSQLEKNRCICVAGWFKCRKRHLPTLSVLTLSSYSRYPSIFLFRFSLHTNLFTTIIDLNYKMVNTTIYISFRAQYFLKHTQHYRNFYHNYNMDTVTIHIDFFSKLITQKRLSQPYYSVL